MSMMTTGAGFGSPRPLGWPWEDDDRAKALDDKVRELLRVCGFVPDYVSTSCVDCPGELTVDGVPVIGRTWIGRGRFVAVRR